MEKPHSLCVCLSQNSAMQGGTKEISNVFLMSEHADPL